MLESLNDHRPWKGMKNKRRLRKILSPIYLFFRLALEFERLHSRLPSSEADISDLFNICIDFLPSELEVEHDILSNDSLRYFILFQYIWKEYIIHQGQ
jgi:hypothetical protein